jgi:glutamate-ammonia-ligase adenylyltransferase
VLRESNFSILALGKLGGRELIFHSDLDLVLVYDENGHAESAKAVGDLLKELRSWLQSYTEVGRAYQIDFRLRPEGRHAAEAVPFSRLVSYFEERAEPWERLAYVKARSVFEHGLTVRLKELVFQSPFNDAEVRELAKIRLRKEVEIGKEEKTEYLDPKVGRGSLLDIQFIVQHIQVNYKVSECNLLSAINKLESESLIDSMEAELLSSGLQFLYSLESIDDLLDTREKGKVSKDPSSNNRLAMWLGMESGEELTQLYLSLTQSIRQIYLKYFG